MAAEENKQKEIDTTNSQLVSGKLGISMGATVIIRNPKIEMTKEEAIRHAAWLVIVSGVDFEQFKRVYEACLNT